MPPALSKMTRYLDRRTLAAAALGVLVLAGLFAATRVMRGEVGAALTNLAAASPAWLWLAAVSFLASLGATGCAWRAGMSSCGATLSVTDAGARYCAGSLVNSVAPGGCGGALRILIFSRTLPGNDRVWRAGGVAGSISAARSLALVPLTLIGAQLAGFGLRPVLVLLGAVMLALVVVLVARRHKPNHRICHVFDVFRALGNAPREAGRLVGWIGVATLGRFTAAGCVAAALAIDAPLEAAAIVVPALALANLLPLTPGNVGVGSGAVAIALHAAGIDLPTAIAVGIAVHALETAVNVLAGATSALYLARLPVPAWSLRVAGAAGCLALVGGFSASVL